MEIRTVTTLKRKRDEIQDAIKLYERFGFRPYILGLLLSTE